MKENLQKATNILFRGVFRRELLAGISLVTIEIFLGLCLYGNFKSVLNLYWLQYRLLKIIKLKTRGYYKKLRNWGIVIVLKNRRNFTNIKIFNCLGSGKRALLEVIARRSKGLSRGQILLDGRPLTQAMFNQCCAYVGHRADLVPSLSVQQTLHYAANLSIGSQVSGYVKDSRVRQVLADLALSQVARHSVEALTEGEYRRLVIGTQLVKDPGKKISYE